MEEKNSLALPSAGIWDVYLCMFLNCEMIDSLVSMPISPSLSILNLHNPGAVAFSAHESLRRAVSDSSSKLRSCLISFHFLIGLKMVCVP